MTSRDLQRSPTWDRMSAAIAHEFRAGVPFADILEMNVAIKQRDLRPYVEHRRRMDSLLWHDDDKPKTIIDLGAGYGAMARFWPEGSRVFNVDLPEMLEVQKAYIDATFPFVLDGGMREDLAPTGGRPTLPADSITLTPFTEADGLPWDGAYLFAAFSLTETTIETWKYYIDKAPRLAGCYVVGWHGWVDRPGQQWPWEELRDAFQHTRSNLAPYVDVDGRITDSIELAAVNR